MNHPQEQLLQQRRSLVLVQHAAGFADVINWSKAGPGRHVNTTLGCHDSIAWFQTKWRETKTRERARGRDGLIRIRGTQQCRVQGAEWNEDRCARLTRVTKCNEKSTWGVEVATKASTRTSSKLSSQIQATKMADQLSTFIYSNPTYPKNAFLSRSKACTHFLFLKKVTIKILGMKCCHCSPFHCMHYSFFTFLGHLPTNLKTKYENWAGIHYRWITVL